MSKPVTNTATYGTGGLRSGKLLLWMMTFFWIMMLVWPAAAQDTDEPAVYTYGCIYDEVSNTVQIRADLTERNGTPLAVDGVVIRNLELPAEAFSIQPVERQPVRIIAVIDTTRSYPVTEIRSALSDQIANFPVLDELALVTFNDRVSALLGPPTTDKIAVIDQYRDQIVPGGDPQAGIAVLYDGILTALRDGIDPAKPERQVVLVLTDSPHRNTRSDTTERDVIDRARVQNTPVYIIAFDTVNDTPDFEVLAEIAGETGGFLWSYGQEADEDKTPATLAEQMEGFLEDFQQSLDAEHLITIDASVLEPDPETLAVPMEVTVTSASREIDLGTFNCIVPLLDHSILFNNLTNNQFIPVGQPLVISTTIDSPFAENEREVRLFLNETQLSGNTIDLEDTAVQNALLPSNNTLSVV